MLGLPDLSSAISTWKDFLQRQDRPSNIEWTFFEDYAWSNQKLYVCGDRWLQNAADTERVYRTHPRRHLGVELSLVAVLDNVSLCSIWVPGSEEEAELRMLSGLKLRIPTRALEACLVNDANEWRRLVSAEHSRGLPSPVEDLLRTSAIV
jgi:hypothetical protein